MPPKPVRTRPASEPNDDDTVTSSQMDEWAEEDAVKGWTTLVKLFILKEWARRCAFVVRWWDRRLPLGD